MACFIVPGTEAIVSTIVTKAIEKKEAKKEKITNVESEERPVHAKSSLVQKMKWLNSMLWGGSALLAFEHVWHGEVVPFFPFLTAASNPADAAEMLHEMGTTGVAMAALVTLVWGCMAAVSHYLETHALEERRTISEQH